MIVGEPDNKKILFFQEIPKRIHLHSNCEKIKFLGRSGVRWTLRVMPPFQSDGTLFTLFTVSNKNDCLFAAAMVCQVVRRGVTPAQCSPAAAAEAQINYLLNMFAV